jgi:hypothetical protein
VISGSIYRDVQEEKSPLPEETGSEKVTGEEDAG